MPRRALQTIVSVWRSSRHTIRKAQDAEKRATVEGCVLMVRRGWIRQLLLRLQALCYAMATPIWGHYACCAPPTGAMLGPAWQLFTSRFSGTSPFISEFRRLFDCCFRLQLPSQFVGAVWPSTRSTEKPIIWCYQPPLLTPTTLTKFCHHTRVRRLRCAVDCVRRQSRDLSFAVRAEGFNWHCSFNELQLQPPASSTSSVLLYDLLFYFLYVPPNAN